MPRVIRLLIPTPCPQLPRGHRCDTDLVVLRPKPGSSWAERCFEGPHLPLFRHPLTAGEGYRSRRVLERRAACKKSACQSQFTIQFLRIVRRTVEGAAAYLKSGSLPF